MVRPALTREERVPTKCIHTQCHVPRGEETCSTTNTCTGYCGPDLGRGGGGGGGTEAVKIIDTSDSFKARLFPFEPEVLPHMHAASYGRIARPFANQSGHTTARTVTNHT